MPIITKKSIFSIVRALIVFAAWMSFVIFSAMLLGLSGDCSSDIENCGELRRYLSIIVLVAGLIVGVFFLVRLVRFFESRQRR